MSLTFARAYAEETLESKVLRLAAFLGRYGGQSIDVVLRRPVRQMLVLSRHVGQLLEDEGPAETATKPRGR